MGEHNVEQEMDEGKSQRFTKALLDDLRALEYMLEHDRIESGVRRIGAEQEMFLVDRSMRPAPLAVEVVERARDERLTSEIARFNLEANPSPQVLTGHCFREMESELIQLIDLARKTAAYFDADILLAGILPTLQKSDLTLENITPVARYYKLNEAVSRLRGGPFSIHIKGLDELQITHDNIMMESCNTSFQVHVQVDPQEFAPLYNIAQAITAPVLAAAVAREQVAVVHPHAVAAGAESETGAGQGVARGGGALQEAAQDGGQALAQAGATLVAAGHDIHGDTETSGGVH